MVNADLRPKWRFSDDLAGIRITRTFQAPEKKIKIDYPLQVDIVTVQDSTKKGTPSKKK
jgi:hypothetical protein